MLHQAKGNLTIKAQVKNSRPYFKIFFVKFSEKIRLDINVMPYFLKKNKKNKNKMSSATFLNGIMRINTYALFELRFYSPVNSLRAH